TLSAPATRRREERTVFFGGNRVNAALTEARAASGPIHITVVSESLATAARLPDIAIGQMLHGWQDLASQLSSYLTRASRASRWKTRLSLDIPRSLHSLPWELAPVLAECPLLWRISTNPQASNPIPPARSRNVMLLRPDVETSFSLESASGVSIEFVYGRL